MLRALIAFALLATPAIAKPPPAGSGHFTYTVQRGDTIECLEQKFGIVPGELSSMNGGRPDVNTYRLVAGRRINVPVQLPAHACQGFHASGSARGAQPSAGARACAVIDRARHYSQQQALALLNTIQHNPTCLRAAEIAAQPTVEALCEAIGNLLHSHHATHAYATSVEALCTAAHLAAHQIHEQAGHGSAHAHGSAKHAPAHGSAKHAAPAHHEEE